MSPRNIRPRGFTLLEMLVVMLLTGMISAILMLALGQVFRLDMRFGKELFNTQQGEMYTEWFRQSINGLMPDHRDGGERFKATAREMSGLTLLPLDTAADALRPFTWSLAFEPRLGESQLRYGRGVAVRPILSWPGNSGRFVYFDEKQRPHDAWPPGLGGPWPQLPDSVSLEYAEADGPRTVVAVPKGPREPLPRLRDLLE